MFPVPDGLERSLAYSSGSGASAGGVSTTQVIRQHGSESLR